MPWNRETASLNIIFIKVKEPEKMSTLIKLTNFEWGHVPLKNAISNTMVKGPGLFGNVEVRVAFRNMTSKTFKYIEFAFQAYNSVYDKVGDYVLKGVGPIAPNESATYSSDGSAWQDKTISSVCLVSSKVTYMDGTTETVPASELSVQFDNEGCAVKLFIVSGVMFFLVFICLIVGCMSGFSGSGLLWVTIFFGIIGALLVLWGRKMMK